MTKHKKQADPDLLARLWQNLMLSWRLMFDRRVSRTAKLIPVAMLAYILSPIDLLPDVLLPFGVADDIGVLLLGLQWFIRSAPPGVVDEYRGGRRAPAQVNDPDAPQIIDGQYHVSDDDNDD
jgi:uncharacterized membrane protein YkvA (DUF1232 family)